MTPPYEGEKPETIKRIFAFQRENLGKRSLKSTLGLLDLRDVGFMYCRVNFKRPVNRGLLFGRIGYGKGCLISVLSRYP